VLLKRKEDIKIISAQRTRGTLLVFFKLKSLIMPKEEAYKQMVILIKLVNNKFIEIKSSIL
jgi:hypothetical protein